jgi:hypothetical protein
MDHQGALEQVLPLQAYLKLHPGIHLEFPVLAYETYADVLVASAIAAKYTYARGPAPRMNHAIRAHNPHPLQRHLNYVTLQVR